MEAPTNRPTNRGPCPDVKEAPLVDARGSNHPTIIRWGEGHRDRLTGDEPVLPAP